MTGEEMLDSLIATHPELWRRMREERAYRTAASDTMVEVVALVGRIDPAVIVARLDADE